MNNHRVLTLTQPWASLVVLNEKKNETRSQLFSFRGPLLIHSSKNFPLWARQLCLIEPFRSVLSKHGYKITDWAPLGDFGLPLGCILGDTQLIGCRLITGEYVSSLDVQERAFGNYEAGRYVLHLGQARRLKMSIPARGQLGLWNWSGAIADHEWMAR